MNIENNQQAPAAGASMLTSDKGYKWIAREIERLDPELDYARIWALSTIYYADDTLVFCSMRWACPVLLRAPMAANS